MPNDLLLNSIIDTAIAPPANLSTKKARKAYADIDRLDLLGTSIEKIQTILQIDYHLSASTPQVKQLLTYLRAERKKIIHSYLTDALPNILTDMQQDMMQLQALSQQALHDGYSDLYLSYKHLQLKNRDIVLSLFKGVPQNDKLANEAVLVVEKERFLAGMQSNIKQLTASNNEDQPQETLET